MNKSVKELERENLKTYIKVFTYFVIVFSALLLLILSLIKMDKAKQAEKQKSLDEVIVLSDSTSIDNISHNNEVIHIPGYPGDFVILQDENGSCAFSSIRVGYFTDTKVMYSMSSGYGILTPLINSDGSPLLYDEDNTT